jgi:hypothetical protein
MRSVRFRRAAILVAGGILLLLLVVGGSLLEATLAPAPPAPLAGNGDDSAQPAATPRPPSTLRKILDAEAAGLLNRPTAWLYRLYGGLDPAQVPAAFKGLDLPGKIGDLAQAGNQYRAALWARVGQARAALATASRHWKEIPDALKARFLPFRQRPTNPQSFWYAQFFGGATSQRALGLAAPAGATSFAYVDAVHTPIRVWYIKDSNDKGRQRAAKLATEIDSSGMWDKEKAVMLGHTPCSDAALDENGGDGRLDIYIVPPDREIRRSDSNGDRAYIPGGGDDYSVEGITIPEDSTAACPSIDFILLNDSEDWDALRSTTAHELFHAFQDSFQQTDDDSAWWAEATATWAEDLVYPTLDQEQSQLQDGGWARNNDGPLGPLDLFEDDGLAQYGAYIWPFYLTHRPGGDPTLIGQIYKASEHQAPIKTLHAMPDWNERFKEFALWNWNWDPVDMYRDHGAHIGPLAQSPVLLGDNGTLSLATASDQARVNLKETSMEYYEVARIDDGTNAGKLVHQLRFDLSGVTGQAGAGVQAIITVGSGAASRRYTEDWSSLQTKTFCRERPAEQVSKVVLVVSNANIGARQTIRGRINVDAIRDACR